MQHETFEARRTPEGAIDVRHYAQKAVTERRAARTATLRRAARASRRIVLALAGFVVFWNVPPMGSVGSREIPYR